MELTLIKFFKLKKLFKLHKRVIKEAYDSENMILNVSSIFGTKFKMDRASRLYAIVNPQVQDMKIEMSEQIVEYNDQGKSTESYVRQWFMNRMFAIQRVLKEKELFDLLTADIEWVGPEGYDNYLIIIKPIIFDEYVATKNKLLKNIFIYGGIFLLLFLIFLTCLLYYSNTII